MTPKIWLFRLLLPSQLGLYLTAPVIFVVLLGVFRLLDHYASGAFAAPFFCAITAYIIPAYAYIARLSRRAVRELQPVLDMPADELEAFIHSLDHQSWRWQIGVFLLGFAGGCAQVGLIAIEPLSRGVSLSDLLISGASFGSFMVWIVMTTVIFSLVQNATRVGRLAQQLRPIDLFRHDRLLPFARVAIASTLSILGSIALFPLLFVDERSTWASSLPGLLATGVPLLALLILPMWPVHRRLRDTKVAAVAQVNARIDERRERSTPEDLEALNTLLTHRKHLQQVPEWPLDTGTMGRLALYILIPPLTWVGAALIENVVDSLL